MLYDFIEQWATRYRPIQHTPEPEGRNRRFFLTTGFMGLADFMRESDIDRSPSIIMETNIDGDFADCDTTNYTIYCAVRAVEQSDGRASLHAIQEAKAHLKKLLTYMRIEKRKHNPLLDGVNPEQAVHYQSEGPIYDGWFAVYFTIEQVNTTSLCIDSNDYIPEHPYRRLTQVDDLLWRADYDTLDEDFARQWFLSHSPSQGGGCSAVRSGNFFGRNLDWYAPDPQNPGQTRADFITFTPATKDRHAVKGICSVEGLTAQMATDETPSDLWRIMPFMLQDGINDRGVTACMNVVPRDKGETTYTTPTIEQRNKVSAHMLVRYMLDHFATALEAVEYIQRYVSIYMPQSLIDMGYDLHFKVDDRRDSFVLEFVEGTVHIIEHHAMTNFHIDGVQFLTDGRVYTNADVADGHLPSSIGITPYAAGLERYNLIALAYPTLRTHDDMRRLLTSLLYTRAYKEDTVPYWYSEFTDREYGVTTDTPNDNPTLLAIVQAAQEIYRHEREGRTWITTHSVIYDIEHQHLNIVSYEKTGKEWKF